MIQKVKACYLGLSIKNKIIVIFLPLSIIPLIIIGYLAISIYNNTMIERTRQNMLDNASLIQMRMDAMIEDTVNCSNMLLLNMNKFLKDHGYMYYEDDLTFQLGFVRLFNEAMIIYPQIDSIYMVSNEGTIYSTDRHENLTIYQGSNPIVEEIEDSLLVDNWFQIERRTEFTTDESLPVMTLGKKIINIESGRYLGTLIMNIQESTLSALYNNQKYQKNSEYYIIDTMGRYISTVHKELLFLPTNIPVIDKWIKSGDIELAMSAIAGESLMVSLPANAYGNWYLISESRLNDVMVDTKKTIWTIIIAVIACILCIFIGTDIVMRYITEPINRIKKGMIKIGDGDFDIAFDVHSHDEIGLFARGFNQMTRKIKELLERIQIEQQLKRTYELALMQNQIKPHFLYNCLDQIYVLVAMDKKKNALSMTKKLADFYRGSLSQGKEIISLSKELENVSDYLAIQKIRYQEFLSYDIHYDKGVDSVTIPKLTLQPIVENAIYHGIKEKDDMGYVEVRCSSSQDYINIEIIDNGIGMSEEQIQHIFQKEKQDNDHFGLWSIRKRLMLYYDHKSEFAIESEKGLGTKIRIRIPSKEERNHDKSNDCR